MKRKRFLMGWVYDRNFDFSDSCRQLLVTLGLDEGSTEKVDFTIALECEKGVVELVGWLV